MNEHPHGRVLYEVGSKRPSNDETRHHVWMEILWLRTKLIGILVLLQAVQVQR